MLITARLTATSTGRPLADLRIGPLELPDLAPDELRSLAAVLTQVAADLEARKPGKRGHVLPTVRQYGALYV